MISNFQEIISTNAKGMKKSAIRELLKLVKDPEIISFAGGLPAPETFPRKELSDIVVEVIEQDGAAALQYGATEGDDKLRELIMENYKELGFDITIDNVMITTGSIILFGVTIGDGAVVGAGSVVTKDVQEGAFVSGNPARDLTKIAGKLWKMDSLVQERFKTK